MVCFFNLLNESDIQKYKQIPFHDDFYLHVVKMGLSSNTTEDEIIKERNLFKKNMMYILFDENKNNRFHNSRIQLMSKVFPKLNTWIETILELIGGRTFSLLLQRTESYLLLNCMSRRFYQENPSVPLFTIHDGLYTYQESISDLRNLIVEDLTQIIG